MSIVGRKRVHNTEGKYGWVKHPEAEREEIYRLRVLLQGDLNMWDTAFDEVAEAFIGITVKPLKGL